MLHGMQWQVDAGHGAYFARPQPGRIDHMFGDQRALLHHDFPLTVGSWIERGHSVAEIDFGPLQARRLGVGMCRA